jgi:hypothetical protein
MYALSHPGAEISEIIKPYPDPLANIQYSCVYMLERFLKSFPDDIDINHSNQVYDTNDIEKIYKFFKCFLLNWLEALCLMKQLQRSMISVHNIVERLEVDFEQESLRSHSAFAFIKDTFRFMFSNLSIVEKAPLHIYVSALVFSPRNSVVRHQFQKELSWIKTLPVVDEYWDSCKYSFFCPEDDQCSYAVSYDSKFAAAGYGGGKIQI